MREIQCAVQIVVVGASDTGMAFLESLTLHNPDLNFTTLTLVSTTGLPMVTNTPGPLPYRTLLTFALQGRPTAPGSANFLPWAMYYNQDKQTKIRWRRKNAQITYEHESRRSTLHL